MKHTCSTAILHCIDFRLGNAIENYKKEHALAGDCDIISVAGAAANIANPKNDIEQAFVLRQLELSKKLHDIQKIVLINHTDCGAYGGASAFASKEEEREKHRADLQSAQETIKKLIPDVSVELSLAVLQDNGTFAIETIA